MKAYDIVRKARDVHRMSTIEVIQALCSDFIELHGDRRDGDDQAIIGGVGMMDNNQPVTIIGLQKGRDTAENIRRNFGSSGPSGYRKAQRLMKQSEKFNRPILTLINTAGAHAAPESEEKGIGQAIAESLTVMSELTVPTLAIILGEGGSGGAIALALSNQVWMMENSIYSILSPEGFASILWKDASKAEEAAEMMKLTAFELKELDIIDRIIPENEEKGEKLSNRDLAHRLAEDIQAAFEEMSQMTPEELSRSRYDRFRKY